ncbi:hypothetical protein DIE18_07255 [Burkholderia sp. Bp9125]|nr:hypothetical protein DIE18_07255 [Burkholderia sp. Bp9125]
MTGRAPRSAMVHHLSSGSRRPLAPQQCAPPADQRPSPGATFSNTDRFDAFIRLGCTRAFDAQHEAAYETLGRLVHEAAGV